MIFYLLVLVWVVVCVVGIASLIRRDTPDEW
jgi:hypothetical protein